MYAFTDLSASKSYKDPYDLYCNRPCYDISGFKQLSLIINGIIIEHLDTKLISVKWAIACAKRVLPIFEASYQDDRPRRAIEAAELWVLKPNAATAANANTAAYAADAVDAVDATAYSAAYATAAVAYSAATDNAATYAGYAATYATYAIYDASNENPFISRNAESQWQRYKLKKIIKEHSIYYKTLNKILTKRIPPELSSLITNFL